MKIKYKLQIGSWFSPSILGGTLPACASSGTEPHRTTAGQHEAAAQAEKQAAGKHQAQYDPSQTRQAGPTAPSIGAYSTCIEYQSSKCYVRSKSTENATDRQVKEAQVHKKMAEKRRTASKAVVDAEQRFCSRIPAADRDFSPFYHREDITAAQGLKKLEGGYGFSRYGPTGGTNVVQIQQLDKEVFGPGDLQEARITFRAVPGMTGEWLQRAVDCHLARNAVVGNDPTMSFCPLAVPHATAAVTSTGKGFAIDITSDDAGSVQEIIKRAWTVGPSGPTVVK